MADQLVKCCMCKEELPLSDVASTDSKGQAYCDGCAEIANDYDDYHDIDHSNNFEC